MPFVPIALLIFVDGFCEDPFAAAKSFFNSKVFTANASGNLVSSALYFCSALDVAHLAVWRS